jgi:predicted PurR-regulated permease PerM
MIKKGNTKKYLALAFILVLFGLIAYGLFPYVNAFFGAFILFIMFRKLHLFFVSKFKMNKSLSAILIIIISLIIIIIPTSIIINTVISESSRVSIDSTKVIEGISLIEQRIPGVDIQGRVSQVITKFLDYFSSLFFSTLQGIGRAAISFVIMFFVLYFLLIDCCKIEGQVLSILPFNKKNSSKLYQQAETITKSTIITSGLMALLQGSLLTIGLLVFGIKGAFFWGFIGTIFSFLPMIGTPIIWVPVVISLFAQSNYVGGTIFLIWGLFISYIDNILRPFVQKRMGEIHPIITLLGVIFGLPMFGLLGILIGPLIISYFLLATKMFKEEFL